MLFIFGYGVKEFNYETTVEFDNIVHKDSKYIDWSPEMVDKQGYPYYMIKEIYKIIEKEKPDMRIQRPTDFVRKPASPISLTYGKAFQVNKAAALDYTVGDCVRHMKFGTGIVINVVDGGKDFEVTVDFEKSGVKKMFASFAKLKLVD